MYSFILFAMERCLNLYILFRFCSAIAVRIFIWLVNPVLLMFKPKILPELLYGMMVLLMVTGAVFLLLMGMSVNLVVFVCIFHLFSKLLICSMACLVVFAIARTFFAGLCMIWVMSSAYAMYSEWIIGSGRSWVKKLYRVGERHAP